jgi:NAD(P)-dependent dehydrogenase (short-subunit alcohol dehydrogenase family)
MQLDFNGRAGIVTGGASGIGEATARAFAKAGAAVMLADVQADLGEAVAQAIRNEGGRAEFLPCDVSSEADVAAAVAGTVAAFGSLDFAFNNAGVTGTGRKTADYELADWDRLMGINLRGVFLCMKHEIRRMRAQGGGAIVNTSSVAGLVGRSGSPAYVSSKHGVVGLTKTVAVEYGAQNIRCNAVAPGFVETPMIKPVMAAPQFREMAASTVPAGRVGRAEEIANVVVWACSDRASYVNGAVLAADGGFLAR